MVKQIVLNFDATGFEGYESCRAYFWYCSSTLKEESTGLHLKKHYQAADMDMSPQQWGNKLNDTNNTTITLHDAELYTEKFGDTRWINYLVWKHIVNSGRDIGDLMRMRDELDKQIEAKKKKK